MNRITAYAGISVSLAASILLHAFTHRPNTYSALVYLSQSNASVLILANFVLLTLGTIYFLLQRLCFGTLRPVEIETLYERGWYQATELCLAATIFRDEVGWAFGGLFAGILAGKVWGWLGEGRVEFMQQRPPDNPRLFHMRLSAALLVGLLFDALMLKYCVDTVLEQARPGMFVMFSFEFAVLGIQSISTLIRYAVILREQWIVKEQQKERQETRRAEVRAEAERAAEAARAEGREPEAAPAEELEIDPADEDVPGWEAKGNWLFALDLATDFIKSLLYLTFFCILLVFHGFPVHIIRDLIMTVRSLITRITGFIAYRHATRAMNTLPDATAEDLAQDKTCIVCREDMELWDADGPVAQEGQQAPRQTFKDERQRPKKLTCGHILHKGCLKAWLERQQTCPTCRRPVLSTQGTNQTQQANANGQADNHPGHPAPQPNAGRQPGQNPQVQGWRLNLGPLRLFVGRGPADALREHIRQQQGVNANGAVGQPAPQAGQAPNAQQGGAQLATIPQRAAARVQGHEFQRRAGLFRQTRIESLYQEITRELTNLEVQQAQLDIVRALQDQYARLTMVQAQNQSSQQTRIPGFPGFPGSAVLGVPVNAASNGTHAFAGQEQIGAGSPQLPEGMVLPDGWTVMPLARQAELNTRSTPWTGTYPAVFGGVVPTGMGLPLPPGESSATATVTTTIERLRSPLNNQSNDSATPNAPQTFSTSLSIPPPASSSTPVSSQPTVPIGELLAQLAQAQEAAAGPSAASVASPQVETLTPQNGGSNHGVTWSFDDALQEPMSSTTDSTTPSPEASIEANVAAPTGADETERPRDKGKGRAQPVTVEDVPDTDMD